MPGDTREVAKRIADRLEQTRAEMGLAAIAPERELAIITAELEPYRELVEAAKELHVIKTVSDGDGDWDAIRKSGLVRLRAALTRVGG